MTGSAPTSERSTPPNYGSALVFAREWISMDERGYELLPENLNLARAYVAMVEHTTAVEARVGDLEEALRMCGDVLFGTWDDDEERRIASRKAEALTRAVLFPGGNSA